MNHLKDVDVLICGAGAAGLALALELARRELRFLLIDKIDTPFGGSRGKGIQPRTLEIFEDMGIVDRLAAVGGPYPAERHYREDGSHVDSPRGDPAESSASEPYPRPLMVPQFVTEQVLRERLAELGHAPRYATELVDLDQDADGVTARVSGIDGVQAIRARYVVACDGGRSFARSKLGIDFPGKTLGVRAIVADVSIPGLDRAVWHRFNEGSMARNILFCPLPGTALFQVQAPIALEGEVDLTPAGLNAMIEQRTGLSQLRVDGVHWASAYSMNARLADRYRVGRIFLAGDAAHIHPPTGGQGLNTSVQDAYNLGWKLAAVLKGASGALLDSYEDERRPIAAEMLGLSVKLLDAAKKGDLRRGRETRQLDIRYEESALVQANASSFAIASGDRAPDGLLRGAAGQSTRLFDLFRGTHWTLLGHMVDRGELPSCAGVRMHTVGAQGDLLDAEQHLVKAYGLSKGALVLVRPDGHVGATAQAGQAHVITDYLRGIGLAK